MINLLRYMKRLPNTWYCEWECVGIEDGQVRRASWIGREANSDAVNKRLPGSWSVARMVSTFTTSWDGYPVSAPSVKREGDVHKIR